MLGARQTTLFPERLVLQRYRLIRRHRRRTKKPLVALCGLTLALNVRMLGTPDKAVVPDVVSSDVIRAVQPKAKARVQTTTGVARDAAAGDQQHCKKSNVPPLQDTWKTFVAQKPFVETMRDAVHSLSTHKTRFKHKFKNGYESVVDLGKRVSFRRKKASPTPETDAEQSAGPQETTATLPFSQRFMMRFKSKPRRRMVETVITPAPLHFASKNNFSRRAALDLVLTTLRKDLRIHGGVSIVDSKKLHIVKRRLAEILDLIDKEGLTEDSEKLHNLVTDWYFSYVEGELDDLEKVDADREEDTTEPEKLYPQLFWDDVRLTVKHVRKDGRRKQKTTYRCPLPSIHYMCPTEPYSVQVVYSGVDGFALRSGGTTTRDVYQVSCVTPTRQHVEVRAGIGAHIKPSKSNTSVKAWSSLATPGEKFELLSA